jgi:hypothetical protein
MLGGAASTVVLCPLTVIKVQMQMAGRGLHASPLAAASAIWRANGFQGFYRGLMANLGVQVPYSTLFFGIYGMLRDSQPRTTWSPVFCGGVASIATWTLLLPVDTLRTIKMGSVHHTMSKNEISALVKKRVQHSGLKSLWRGFTPVALRALPSSGSSMLVYEWAKRVSIGGHVG